MLIRQKTRVHHPFNYEDNMSNELRSAVLRYVDSRVTASAGEVARALDITIQRAGRYLRILLKENEIVIDHEEDHVPYYSTVPKGKMKVIKAEPARPEPAKVEAPKVEAGYNDGFAHGYEAGRKEAYREAYEDGKRAVLDRLTRILID